MNSISKRVLVTGGTGYVGSWLKQTQPPDTEALYINRLDYGKMNWRHFKWDMIIHAAPINPAVVLKSSKRVMYISSGAVYEKKDAYADVKRKHEQQCLNSGVDVVIPRLFCFTGANLPRKMWDGSTPSILKFIHEGIAGGPVHYYDVGYIRSYMYGEDLGRWLWKMLFDGCGAYDVGASQPVSMRQVARMVARACECEAVQDEVPEQKPLVYLPDTTRARELGCVETIGLREGIERTVESERQRINSI
jgi:nucleoside-diphosphate-sugar epimerase